MVFGFSKGTVLGGPHSRDKWSSREASSGGNEDIRVEGTYYPKGTFFQSGDHR